MGVTEEGTSMSDENTTFLIVAYKKRWAFFVLSITLSRGVTAMKKNIFIRSFLLLMHRIASFRFQAFYYSSFDRRIFLSEAACTRSDNRIFMPDPEWARERVADHLGFLFRNRTR